MNRFGFNIRTKGGHKVDNITIMARDFGEAERRLRQMYIECVILHSLETPVEGRRVPSDAGKMSGRILRHSTMHKLGTQ